MSDETAPPRPPRARRTAADRLRAALADLHQHRGLLLNKVSLLFSWNPSNPWRVKGLESWPTSGPLSSGTTCLYS